MCLPMPRRRKGAAGRPFFNTMIHAAIQSAIKELKILSRDRIGLAFLFLLPAVFMFVMTMALQGVLGEGSSEKAGLLFAAEKGDVLAGRISEGLGGLGWIRVDCPDGADRSAAHEAVARGTYQLAVYVPPGAWADMAGKILSPGRPVRLEVIADPALPPQITEAVRGTVQMQAQRALISAAAPKMASLFAPASSGAAAAGIARAIEEKLSSSAVSVEAVPPENLKLVRKPNSAEQNVPAYTVLGIYFIAIVIAAGISQEKRSGTYKRIAVSAAPANLVVTARIVPFFAVNLLQAALMFGVGTFLIPLAGGPPFSPGASPAGLAAVTACASMSAMGFGVLVSSFGLSTDGTTVFTAVVLVIMAALAGVMVPSFVMPSAMVAVGRLTPQSWALEAYLDLIVRGRGIADVIPNCGILLAFAAVFYAAGAVGLARESR